MRGVPTVLTDRVVGRRRPCTSAARSEQQAIVVARIVRESVKGLGKYSPGA
jgi:hypothetical protein